MYKYGHRTRGHPKLQKLLAFVFALVILVAMVPADMAKADTIEHTHIWATKYDDKNHWEYCTVCSEKRNVTAHTFTETKTWTSTGSCDHYIHYYSCKCGYHYTYTKPHQVKNEWHGTGNRLTDYMACSNCGTWIYQNTCQDASGKRIGCNNPGTCVRCGYTATVDTHYLSQGVCKLCKKMFFKETSGPTVTYSSDYKTCTITFTITPMNSSCSLTGAESYGWTATPNWSSRSMNSVLNSDGSRTFTQKITFNTAIKSKANVGYSGNGLERINGINVFESDYPPVLIWYDHQAPVQNDVIQKDQASANGWATIKQLTLSGTENNSDIVYLTVSDKATGEKYVTDAAVSVVNGKYSYTYTPSIEGDTDGRTYVVTARDYIGNSSTKEFVISKTDGSAPQLKNGTSLTYTDWTTSKDISLSFFDFGSGGVEASLDNQTDYKALTKSGEYYIWNHSFGNQIGTTEHTIYVRDALGNATSYKLTVGNTDSNVYSVSYDLNGGAMSGQKTSYTVTDSFTLPQPTRTGYTFTGWTGSNGTTPQKTVTINKGTRGNLSYTANWSANQYSVTYDANGGTGTMSTDTATYDENYVTKANQFTRTGYEFVGWTTNADGSGSNWTSWIGKPWKWTYTKNITLYAQWKAKTYTITYEPNGGVGDRYTQTATYDAYFKTMKNRFTRTGYTFVGFTDLNGRIGTYAKINKKSFLENNALKHPWNLSKVDSEYQFYNYTDKVWETYCLIYWEGPYNVDYGCSPSNFTLSARWWANNYTVKLDYKKDVSSSYDKTIVTTYDKAYGELPQPVVQGWTFKGWNTKSDGTGTTVTADTVYKIAGDSTLYAQWQYNPVSVKVPQILIGDHTGKSQFRVKCDDFKAGNIKISVPNSFLYKQTGKADITATITSKSGNNTITPTNKVCVYDITTKNGLSAGCWQGSFNIGLTLTKE